jgi:hypothetical protein
MVFRPRGTECRSGTVEDLVCLLTEHTGCFSLDALGVVEMDGPPASTGGFRQDFAVHDRIGTALVRGATQDGDVLGEVGRPASDRQRGDGRRGRRGDLVERTRGGPDGGRSYARHQRSKCVVTERLGRRSMEEVRASFVMDRGSGETPLNQLDPPTVHDVVVG